MNTPYIPGKHSREYENLPASERQKIADEVDRIFTERTGIGRRLDPNGDLAARRRWLRIRDEVMLKRRPKQARNPAQPGRGTLLWSSVGEGGENTLRDVLLVKTMLNALPETDLYDDEEIGVVQPDGSILITVRTLAENGDVSKAMVDKIMRFQRRVVGLEPDGLVNPGGPTIRAMARRFMTTGQVMPVSDPEDRIRPDSVYRTRGGPMWMNGLVFRRGHIVNGLDGERVILSITNQETIFILLNLNGMSSAGDELNPMRRKVGQIYAQSTRAFVGEYETYVLKRIAEDLKPIKTMIEVEMMILMGIGTTLTGTYWFYVGFQASEFIARNRENFRRWIALLAALLAARAKLKAIAPVLYGKLFDAVLMHYLQSVSATSVASMLGRLLGVLGKKALEGRFSLISTVLTLVAGTAVAALKTIGSAAQEAGEVWKGGIGSVRRRMAALGVSLSDEEEAAILGEILARPREIQAIFEQLKATFDQNMI